MGEPGQTLLPRPLVVVHDQRAHPGAARGAALVRETADSATGVIAGLPPFADRADRGTGEHRQQRGR
ncbi:hypothetical protein ABWK57_29230 [Streptomyces sp. NPDC094045]|uniref:hypothetical protein n=1 Tax=unclassified Streptomyces TaxID=2593676 RepID=UPI003394FF10